MAQPITLGRSLPVCDVCNIFFQKKKKKKTDKKKIITEYTQTFYKKICRFPSDINGEEREASDA